MHWKRIAYREANNITGGYYVLHFNNSPNSQHFAQKVNGIDHLGLCLFTNRKYYMQMDPMVWSIGVITDNREYFEKYHVPDSAWCNYKGLLYDLNCWDVLEEIQHNSTNGESFDITHGNADDIGYCEMLDEWIKERKTRKN